MRKLRGLSFNILFSVILIFVIAFCISETVFSQSDHERQMEEKYYDEMEDAYLKELKLFLTEEGYANSGVTMTRVIDESGVRRYTVTIHHKLIDKMTMSERNELTKACGKIAFADEESIFCHKFL